VKNQYFGDNKDLFTYDLVMEIMRAGLVASFTFIPMLTAPDATRHGDKANRRRARAGHKNRELMSFLDGCVAEGRRNIKELNGFFKKQGIQMTTYGGDAYFSQRGRQLYFLGIGDGLLANSLILVDPDNGLEVSQPSEKHLLYAEAKDLYERMADSSILMLYQYLPRVPHQEYLEMRMHALNEYVSGNYPVCVDDDEIAFFFLTKNEALEHSLTHLIADYTERYSG
jgi:hypothetical protein